MSEESTTMKTTKSGLERLRALGVDGEPVHNIMMRLVERAEKPQIDATLKIQGMVEATEKIVKKHVANIETRLDEIENRIDRVESAYRVIVPEHERKKRERERQRITHGQVHVCMCVPCDVEVEVSTNTPCSEVQCEKCGKPLTDKPTEPVKESKSTSQMTSDEIRASDTLTPEEKKKVLDERLRKLVLA